MTKAVLKDQAKGTGVGLLIGLLLAGVQFLDAREQRLKAEAEAQQIQELTGKFIVENMKGDICGS